VKKHHTGVRQAVEEAAKAGKMPVAPALGSLSTPQAYACGKRGRETVVSEVSAGLSDSNNDAVYELEEGEELEDGEVSKKLRT
jgi:hypothetical protein